MVASYRQYCPNGGYCIRCIGNGMPRPGVERERYDCQCFEIVRDAVADTRDHSIVISGLTDDRFVVR